MALMYTRMRRALPLEEKQDVVGVSDSKWTWVCGWKLSQGAMQVVLIGKHWLLVSSETIAGMCSVESQRLIFCPRGLHPHGFQVFPSCDLNLFWFLDVFCPQFISIPDSQKAIIYSLVLRKTFHRLEENIATDTTKDLFLEFMKNFWEWEKKQSSIKLGENLTGRHMKVSL